MYGVMYWTCNPLYVCVCTLVQVHVSILTATFVENKLAMVMIHVNANFDSYYVYTPNGPFSHSRSQMAPFLIAGQIHNTIYIYYI